MYGLRCPRYAPLAGVNARSAGHFFEHVVGGKAAKELFNKEPRGGF